MKKYLGIFIFLVCIASCEMANATALKAVSTGTSGGSSSSAYIGSGVFIDPRNPKYGSNTCTGYYPIATSNITSGNAGTGYVVGDIVSVQNPLNGGGNKALEEIKTVSAGGVPTSYTQVAGGGGYYTNTAQSTNPYSTLTTISQTITGAVSNGGLIELTMLNTTGFLTGAQVTVSNVNGTVEANTSYDTPYWTVTVTNSTHLTLQGSTFTNAFTSSPTAQVVRVGGSGLQFDINTVGVGNDDTVAITAALADAAKTGAAVLPIDGCWISATTATALEPIQGSTIAAYNGSSTYGGDITIKPVWYVIGSPTDGIINSQNAITMRGFQLDGQYDYNTNIVSSTGIGTENGNTDPGGFGAPTTLDNMSIKNFAVAYGTIDGLGNPLFTTIINSDLGLNGIGVYGPLSDFIVLNDRFASGNICAWLPDGPGGSARFEGNRCEFVNQYGFRLETGGGAQSTLIGNQIDRSGYAGWYFNNSFQISVIGGSDQASGIAGTLTVTGAAKCAANNNVCLTVSSKYGDIGGGAATGGLVTGDVAVTSSVGGATGANGTATITVVDGTHIDLQGTTFGGSYTSGGISNIKGKDSEVLLNGTENDMHFVGVMWAATSDGAIDPFAYVAEDTAGDSISDIFFIGGMAHSGANYQTGGYSVAFANWLGGTPPDLNIDVAGTAQFRNTNFAVTGTISQNGSQVYSAVGTGLSASSATVSSNATSYVPFSTYFVTALANAKGGFAKISKASTLDNLVGSANQFTCSGNPILTMYECGVSTTCATPTTMSSTTLTAAGTAVSGTISSSAIAAGDFVAFEVSGGTCTLLNASATAQIHSN